MPRSGSPAGADEPVGADEGAASSDELARRAEDEAIAEATAAVARLTAWDEGPLPRPGVCRFLRRIDGAGRPSRPAEALDPANCCVASVEPQVQSLRQQQLLCLQVAHAHCPRFVQSPVARFVGSGGAAPPRRRIGRPTAVALAILLVSAAVAGAFVIARGGLDVPMPGIAGVSPSLAATTSSAPASSAAPTSPPGPTLEATLAPTPQPPATAIASLVTPAPTSDRLALLDPCPDRPDCYLYTVRRGDTLHKIADTFGVPYSTVRALNPQIVDPNVIRVGDRIVLPPPTR